jgi:hypothetical protein
VKSKNPETGLVINRPRFFAILKKAVHERPLQKTRCSDAGAARERPLHDSVAVSLGLKAGSHAPCSLAVPLAGAG